MPLTEIRLPPQLRALLCAALCLACGMAVPAASAARRTTGRPAAVPQGFFGTVLGDPLFPGDITQPVLSQQMNLMVSSGVESLRVVFDWGSAQPYQTWSQVPAGQQQDFTSDGVDDVPTDFAPLDALVAAAAQRRLSVLPVILNAPGWDGQFYSGASVDIPLHDASYAAFCKALVLRYGPNGSFWKQSGVKPFPITTWQVWNEPNVANFWPPQPFAKRYVALLRVARTAIRSADPHAKIVLAGLANYSWEALRSIYAIQGARKLFDIVGLHPYTKKPQGVVTILSYARQVMDANGDSAKPMIADEISWPSSKGKTVHDVGYDFATTEAGQARDVAAVLPLLAANRVRLNLLTVYYYTWASIEVPNGLAFTYAGLLKDQGGRFVRKPAFYAFRRQVLALERCHAKGTVADRCLRPY